MQGIWTVYNDIKEYTFLKILIWLLPPYFYDWLSILRQFSLFRWIINIV